MESSPADVQIAVLTPPGRGAIATISVHGPRATTLVSQHFRPLANRPLADQPGGSLVVGHFQSGNHAGEELVVAVKSPREVEIHCHGGAAAIDAITRALQADGCRVVPWREIPECSGRHPLDAAALVALAGARTERAAALLLSQARGALRGALWEMADALQVGQIARAQLLVERLLQHADVGLHLAEPWKVVLVGPPNVGKSRLINALLGYERSIVYDQPGTTRDVLTAATAIDGWPIELSDTAGLRASGDAIESQGIARARRQLREADLALLLAENQSPWSAEQDELLRSIPANTKRLVVHSKSDLGAPAASNRPKGIAVSAVTGDGLDELCRAISAALVPSPPGANDPLPFTLEQVRNLQQVAANLQAGNIQTAANLIHQLLAESSPPTAAGA